MARAIGLYDLEVSLAMRFNWTPDEVASLDPRYVAELQGALEAEDRYTKSKQGPASPGSGGSRQTPNEPTVIRHIG